MNSVFDIEHWLNMSKNNCQFALRRTPRRKLVFSSSEDETDTSPQSIPSVHLLQDEQLSTTIVTRSKLEHYGFNTLARPVKRHSSIAQNQLKKLRANESCHSMQTRSQSSSDSHSDHLANLFDRTLSTVAHRQKRCKPLPLCLSDNDTNMPILTRIPSDGNKRTLDDEENSDQCRSIKRTKCFDENNKENDLFAPQSSNSKRSRRAVGLIRSLTEPNEEQIKASVELGTNRDLIGDRSCAYLLPRCQSRKHPDLACISPETLIDVLQNVYSSEIENIQIIDCRYPYEYEGGHIQSARNLYTRSQIYEQFFRQPLEVKNPSKRTILIFHCEFSSERAPSLLRYFRSEDRSIHEKSYPQLHYPEIYLLEGGYKGFYEYSKEFCFPRQYRMMIDVNYQEDYRRYRCETKQLDKFRGSNETTGGGRRTRTVAFRSYLSQPLSSRPLNIHYDFRFTDSPSDH